jgi:hypothetical protein
MSSNRTADPIVDAWISTGMQVGLRSGVFQEFRPEAKSQVVSLSPLYPTGLLFSFDLSLIIRCFR